ncbi:prolyl oligopeptidase family serine peptidase [Neptunicella sp. SCSIO 80796]|uniref:carboxylesterase family protein n=1 Tax=Neptunicella plasticusilytica TaxID=3117012 RepID=UPI003A4E1B95
MLKQRYRNILLLSILLCIGHFSWAEPSPRFEEGQFKQLDYRILYPADFDPAKQYPLVLVLHGAGERGDDNKAQLVHGSQLFLQPQVREKFPAIVIFPQAPKSDYWANVDVDRSGPRPKFSFKDGGKPTTSMALVMELMDNFSSQSYVDNSRIYVGGLSMGGMGTFEILSRKPDIFAAAFAICGGGDPAIVSRYRNGLPIWIFHGEKDDIVSPRYSRQMADAISKQGGKVKLTLYPEANHNSWDSAFAEPQLLPWLFAQRLTR